MDNSELKIIEDYSDKKDDDDFILNWKKLVRNGWVKLGKVTEPSCDKCKIKCICKKVANTRCYAFRWE